MQRRIDSAATSTTVLAIVLVVRHGVRSYAMTNQTIVPLDLEGVLVPEIWIAVAERTGIAELRRTTRDEPDYDVLM